jgi:hypothetical protein
MDGRTGLCFRLTAIEEAITSSIPALKLIDQGLADAVNLRLTSLFED